MSDLSPDARDLIAQARNHGSELLGPSAHDRARLRDRLTPLWQADVVEPRAATRLRWRLGSAAIIAVLGMSSALYLQPALAPMHSQAPATASQRPTSDATPEAPLTASAPATDPPGAATELASEVNDSCASGSGASCRPRVAAAALRTATQPTTRKSKGAELGARTKNALSPAAQPTAAQPTAAQPTAAQPTTRSSKASELDARTKNALRPAAQPTPAQPTATPDPVLAVEADPVGDKGVSAHQTERSGARHTQLQPVRRGPVAAASADTRLPLRASDERTPARAVRTDPDPTPPSIDGELELLGAAQAALQKQRPSRALSLLQEHAFRFPAGALIEERMAMQALALCALQRRTAAQIVLSNLAARDTQSQLLPRVRSRCGL